MPFPAALGPLQCRYGTVAAPALSGTGIPTVGVGSWAVRAFGSVHGPTYPPDIADQWRCQTPKVKSTPQWQTT
jgi:hypothetical protein